MSAFAVPGLMPLGDPLYIRAGSLPQLLIHRGVSFQVVWPIARGNEIFTGCSVRAAARSDSSRCVLFELAPSINTAGLVTFNLSAAQTLAFPAGAFWTDLLLDRPDGRVELRVERALVLVENSNSLPAV